MLKLVVLAFVAALVVQSHGTRIGLRGPRPEQLLESDVEFLDQNGDVMRDEADDLADEIDDMSLSRHKPVSVKYDANNQLCKVD